MKNSLNKIRMWDNRLHGVYFYQKILDKA